MEIIQACFPLFGMFIILSTPVTLYVVAITAYHLRKMPPLDALVALIASHAMFYMAKSIDEQITLTISLFVSVYCASSAFHWAMHNLRDARRSEQTSRGSTFSA